MPIRPLETVVLVADLPRHGLKQGDLGAVVEVYDAHHFDVEFVTGSGETRALVMLDSTDVRPVGPQDIPAVRTPAGGSSG